MHYSYFLFPLLVHASPFQRRDNCGPKNQSQPLPDTCTTPVTGPVSDPAAYAVTVDLTTDFQYGDTGSNDQVRIDPTWTSTCGPSIQNLCNTTQSQPLGRWTWDYTSPTCLVGVYLPNVQNLAPVPSVENCMNLILKPMATIINQVIQSSGSPVPFDAPNRGRINLKEFPHGPIAAWRGADGGYGATPAAPATNGVAVNEGYPSWMMQGGLGPSGKVPSSAGQQDAGGNIITS